MRQTAHFSAGSLACAHAVLLALTLAACDTISSSEAKRGQLYGEVYRDVIQYHIDQTSPDHLAMNSLDALHAIDPSLSVSEAAGVVSLRSADGARNFRAPSAGDSERWGTLAARIVAAAREASPRVAALGSDNVDERLLGAALEHLDQFSRYVPPEEALQQRAERDGYAGLGLNAVTLDDSGAVAVLEVRDFNADTARSTAQLLAKAHRDKGASLRGIVLDLRSNPGGILDQAVELASLFLDRGLVLESTGRTADSRRTYFVEPQEPVERLPLAVLIDGHSASASEVLAAALQDRGRAAVIGTASFGKGTAQAVFRTRNDGELRVTWEELLSPEGYRLNHHGVVPTFCTSGLNNATTASDVSPSLMRPLSASRARLDDAGWRALRARCPPERDARSLDLAIAERIVTEPALYQAALIPTALGSMGAVRSAQSGG